MGQSYVDNETNEEFLALFSEKEAGDLERRMNTLKEQLASTHTLKKEVTGDSFEEVISKLKESKD